MPLRTRAEIYGKEAAALLQEVSLYPGIREGQLSAFYPGKEGTVNNLLSHRVSGYLLYRTKAAPSLAESPVYSYISIQYNDFFYKAMHQGIKPITVPSFNNTR